MTIPSFTLWKHRPCNKDMSFGLDDRPDRDGEFCDVCRVTNTRWGERSVRDMFGDVVEDR